MDASNNSNSKLTDFLPPQYKSQNPLLVAEFLTPTNKRRVLHAHEDHIYIANKHKMIALSFETKFQLLRHPVEERYKLGTPYGLKLERERTKHTITLNLDNVDTLKKWRDFLAGRINQRCFHESFRAHRKIGKGNFASVYLADRLEDERSFAIKAFSKEVAYA